MSVFAPALSMLWQTIESYQLDPEALFSDEGVQVSIPIDPHLRIPGEALDRVRARAIEMTGDAAFGLKVADHLHPSHFGALGYAWLASSSLRKALERMSLYIHLFNEESEVTVEEEPDCLVVTDRVYSQTSNPAARDEADAVRSGRDSQEVPQRCRGVQGFPIGLRPCVHHCSFADAGG